MWLFWDNNCNLFGDFDVFSFESSFSSLYSHHSRNALFLPGASEFLFTLETNCTTEIMEEIYFDTQTSSSMFESPSASSVVALLTELSSYSCETQNVSASKNVPYAWDVDYLDYLANKQYSYPVLNNNFKDNVSIWILDTGVNQNHIEFAPHQVISLVPEFNRTNAHGTGTGSCAGGIHVGLSKHIPIYDFPVCRFGGSCGSSDVVAGLETAYNFTKLNNKNKDGKFIKRTVINMSLGSFGGVNLKSSGFGSYLDSLFKDMVAEGAIIVVAAGNGNADACTWYYSFSDYVISVGSVDQPKNTGDGAFSLYNNSYLKSTFSNYGSCVDVWYYGSSVLLAYSPIANDTITYKSGTSFASPLVAGIVANLLIQNMSYTLKDLIYILNDVPTIIKPSVFSCNATCHSLSNSNKAVFTRQNKFCNSLSAFHCVDQRYNKMCEYK